MNSSLLAAAMLLGLVPLDAPWICIAGLVNLLICLIPGGKRREPVAPM